MPVGEWRPRRRSAPWRAGRPAPPWQAQGWQPRSGTRARPCTNAQISWSAWSYTPTPEKYPRLDLHHHRQHHRTPSHSLVDELRHVVVEVALEQVDLGDLLVRRAL